jgi:hypothetical protein
VLWLERNKSYRGHAYIPLVPNWVFSRLPSIACSPKLALMNPRATNVRAFVHDGTARELAILTWPLFHRQIEAAMRRRACRKVPSTSHIRLRGPMRSPMRPMMVPALNDRSDVKAC